MDFSTNHYKKFLIDEVMRSCNCKLKNAIDQVNLFSVSEEFKDSFEKWKRLTKQNEKKPYRPKSIQDILILMGIMTKK